MPDLIPSTPFGRRVRRRLQQELVMWLTTVDAQGGPQPRPVWFHWDGRTMLLFSQPGAAKLRHIARNPRAALHFNSDAAGDDFAVFLGRARALKGRPPKERMQAYLRKYRKGIRGLNMTVEEFLASYSVAVLVRPDALRGW